MITKKTALKEAGKFAVALEGPLGRRPLQPVIREFLPLFRDLRSSGANWSQIAALFAAAGVRSGSGQPLTDGVLRAMVSRAERASSPASAGEGKMPAMEGHRPVRHAGAPETPSPRPAARQSSSADHAALTDVAERIRRASALRSQS
ncbi:hypothetical protein EET67_00795 [Pseudaminobacter arsenicus]|uniref:Uncharacterized protein n=1 Tax=Borborobacter arsenicus TaxID=1851146 RepID=A0A432VBD5_9HYPH|nr:hypothetical protein [Pseudaminobacter arsenicus]RUM99480.1 hypothetical protein EET67_00795 [Pseudaminobacter arsenicus]